MKRILLWLTVVLSVLLVLWYWATGDYLRAGLYQGEYKQFDVLREPANGVHPYTLRIMTWNIAYGYGFGSAGNGYVHRDDPNEFTTRLLAMADLIRKEKVDIVLFQEVDFDARRSHFLNQAQYLAEQTGLRYVAPVVSWKAGYVPFPYTPIRGHFRKTHSGGAVLSRYPIMGHQFVLHPKPEENPWWYNAFYLYRYTQYVHIQHPKRLFWIANSHLEAWSKTNRAQQVSALPAWERQLNLQDPILVFGGDFNTMPQTAAQLHNFWDDADDDYVGDQTLAIVSSWDSYRESVADSMWLNKQAQYYTYPAHQPNRRLDYLFVHKQAGILSTKVIQTGELSDHLPVLTTIVWK